MNHSSLSEKPHSHSFKLNLIFNLKYLNLFLSNIKPSTSSKFIQKPDYDIFFIHYSNPSIP